MFINNPTIGADIEVFLRNESGEIVTAEGIIQGTKKEPFKFDENNHFYATSLDNVMAEFCIPPARNASEFYESIQKALAYINSTVPKELSTYAFPAMEINPKYLDTPNAKLFGCEPDTNAWTEIENLPPGTSTNLRTCGGHIHIGYDNPLEFFNISLIKAMDLFVGIPFLFLEPDNQRKTMYGKAGAFRHKKYGVEYRTISNYYINDKKLTEFVYENTLKAIDFVNNGGTNQFDPQEKEDIVNSINYNDLTLAKKVINKYNVKLAA